jgi:tetratricopeptide (TPR) repeat protein
MAGIQLTQRRSRAGRTLHDVNWFGSKAGIVYWLHLSSDAQSPVQLVMQARELFDRLALYDPDRTVSVRAAATRIRSERYGYTLDLSGTGIAEAARAGWPKRVEFAGALPDHDLAELGFFVIPVHLRELSVDPDIADAALCAMVQPLVPAWGKPRVADADGARIREFDAAIEQSGRLVSYRARIFQRAGYFIAVSASVTATPDRTRALLATTALLRLDPSPPAQPPARLDDRESMRQALFYNAVGVAYGRARRFAEAIPFFERADGLLTADATSAGNLAESRLKSGRAREAIQGTDEALKRFPGDPTLLGWRGLARLTLGDEARGAEDLRRAYDGGTKTEDVIAAHVLVLTERKQYDAALAALDRSLRDNDSTGVRMLRAVVLHRAGRREESVASLLELLRRNPDDPTLFGVTLGTAIGDGDPATFLSATESLVAQDRTGLVLYLRAFALQALGRTEAAIAAIDAALQLSPDSLAMRALRDRLTSLPPSTTQRGT